MPGKKRDSLEPVKWKNGVLEAIDQTKLPGRIVYVRMRTVDQVCSAIRSMKVRGAPLIGVVGGYGLALAAMTIRSSDLNQARSQLRKCADSLISTETRPLLQGSRLTAFELSRDGIPVRVICDSAAAQLMAQGMVDKVVVGADRILGTGHVTNKIGTLQIALGAKFFGVPFYVAAPVSTLDLVSDVSRVVIEERDQREVLLIGGRRFSPRNVGALNPAFDITPPELVTGIVTDRGVVGQPLAENIRAMFN